MHRQVFATLAVFTFLLMPAESSGKVTFNPIDEIPGSHYWPEGLRGALDSRDWSHGLEFLGWGQHSITLYYQGDARDFQAFMESLRTVWMVEATGHGAIPQADIPWAEQSSLSLVPGRGKHGATSIGLKEEFEYDWQVHVTHTFNDELGHSYVTPVSDKQGRTVRRRIAPRSGIAPRLTTQITWHVGDGATLSEIDLPTDWLLDHETASTSPRSIYVSPPRPDEINEKTLLGNERIERYLARERRERQQAEAAWRISEFYGITIDLDPEAKTPAISAGYRGAQSRFDVKTGERLTEDDPFPKTAASLVKRWLDQERTAILEQWRHAKNDEPIGMVEPLE